MIYQDYGYKYVKSCVFSKQRLYLRLNGCFYG